MRSTSTSGVIQETERVSADLPCSTRSLCPVCLATVDARLFEQDGQVLMSKACPRHGPFNELISSDAAFFIKLRRAHYERPEAVDNPNCPSIAGCPSDCGLCERHLSSPVMVNVDLTSRCNLNCPICFAGSNSAGRICDLTLEQFDRMLDLLMDVRPQPPSCLQFAGGEPTIHKDFIEAVRRTRCRGIYVEAATNGLRFAQSLEFCQQASQAGLSQVYLQFDGLDDEIYLKARGRGLLEIKLQAIENIAKANMRTVLVPTLVKGLNDHQVGEIVRFALARTDSISAISWQPVAITGRIDEARRRQMRYTTADLARDLQAQCGFLDMHRDWYPFSVVHPFIRLMELATGKPQAHYGCHPHCGCATYLMVDKQTCAAVPLPAFMDIEPAMAALDKAVARIERHPWATRWAAMRAARSLRRNFHAERAPEGWRFEDFTEFIQSFLDLGEQQSDKAQYVARIRRQRFGTLLLAAMHFQDSYNFELDRCRRCVILYAAPNGRLYPFCTWNSGPCHRRRIERMFATKQVQADH